MRYTAVAALMACIPVANWLIGNVGTKCIPGGPCLVPVGFGLLAPSGVVLIGVALVLRDFVQQAIGVRWTAVVILAGAVLSGFVAPPALVVASVLAFLLSEMADMAVYTPLRERRLALAFLLSGVVGSAVDSAIFLWLAFGSLAYLPGQFVGKMWASVLAFVVIASIRRRATA